jgi:tetratricopeptide (TPR) repeat protein
MPFFVTAADSSRTIDEALAALRAGDAAAAAGLLRPLAGSLPEERMPWSALANAEIMLGNLSAATQAVDRQLTLAPRDIPALLQRGWLHEKAGNTRAAASFYQAARNQAAAEGRAAPELTRLLDHAARYCASASDSFAAQLAQATSGPLSPAMAEAVDLLRGEREIDLQRPSVFYYPGLAQRRFFDPGDFPWLEPMLALIPAMQSEWERIRLEGAAGFAPYVQAQPDRPAPNNPLLGSQAWTALHFWRDGEIVEENARRCPATMEALACAPMPRIAGRSPNAHWSRLLPGAHITPHHGMLNTRLICHIPIKTAPHCSLRVGSETRTWRDGEALIFDDSIEHEARNGGDEERVVLLFEIWRPEIPEDDRAAIGRIFQAIGEFGA